MELLVFLLAVISLLQRNPLCLAPFPSSQAVKITPQGSVHQRGHQELFMTSRRLPKEQSYAAIQKPQTEMAPGLVAWGIFADLLMEMNRMEILHLCHWRFNNRQAPLG